MKYLVKLGQRGMSKYIKELGLLCLEYRKTLVRKGDDWDNKKMLRKQKTLSKKILKKMEHLESWLKENKEIIKHNDDVRSIFY